MFFQDILGIRSKMMIEDWETGQLYWLCWKNIQVTKRRLAKDVKKNT